MPKGGSIVPSAHGPGAALEHGGSCGLFVWVGHDRDRTRRPRANTVVPTNGLWPVSRAHSASSVREGTSRGGLVIRNQPAVRSAPCWVYGSRGRRWVPQDRGVDRTRAQVGFTGSSPDVDGLGSTHPLAIPIITLYAASSSRIATALCTVPA